MKTIICVVVILISITSCKKDKSDSSVSGILKRHAWYEYKVRDISYDVSGLTPIVTKDTSYYTSDCIQQSTYQFFNNGNVSFTDKCRVKAPSSTGTWNVRTDNFLNAAIPQVILGQTYYFGISGYISEIDEQHFTVKNYQTLSYSSCDNLGNCSLHKDSTVHVYTYNN